MEQYISFSIDKFQFLDSLQFMSASLETLVRNLKAGTSGAESFPILQQAFPASDDQQLLLRKGVFPYEFLTDRSKFLERQLPPKEAFYSRLRQESVTDADYDYAQQIWNHFKMERFGEYHDLYLKTDVLLLADVMENFRKLCLKSYSIDPCYVFSTPGFTWQAGLRYTKVQLELLRDVEMYLFFERGIRGGISTIIHRHSRANNKYMIDFDPNKPSKYLIYLDMNNLYGHAMMQPMPEYGFEWLTNKEIAKLKLMQLDPFGRNCYIFECDLSIPEEFHDRMNTYPLAPESIVVEKEWLSPFSKRLFKNLYLNAGQVKKLVPTLKRKEKYICHFRNLQFYLRQGARLEKVHRVIRCTQSNWLKSYIAYNTEQRVKAENNFEKDYYKLLNNAFFGKTMESVRKRIEYQTGDGEEKPVEIFGETKLSRFHCVQR